MNTHPKPSLQIIGLFLLVDTLVPGTVERIMELEMEKNSNGTYVQKEEKK